MSKNYFAPHEIVAKIFRAPSKIVKNFSYPTHIRSARVPGIINGRSLKQVISYISTQKNLADFNHSLCKTDQKILVNVMAHGMKFIFTFHFVFKSKSILKIKIVNALVVKVTYTYFCSVKLHI